MKPWRKCSRAEPCPVCGKGSGWCKVFLDGGVPDGAVMCMWSGGMDVAGWRLMGVGDRGGAVYRRRDDTRRAPVLSGAQARELDEERRAVEAAKIQRVMDRWNEARIACDNDVAIGYLRERGVPVDSLPAFSDAIGADGTPKFRRGELPPTIVGVRQWDDEWYDEQDGRWKSSWSGPAMLAVFVNGEHQPTAISQVFLDPEDPRRKRPGDRAAKKTMGVIGHGGAVRLGAGGAELIVCEGVETGLAIAGVTGMPVWCTLGTSGLARPGWREKDLAPEGVVRTVTFAADHDAFNEMLGARPGEHYARAAAQATRRDWPGVRVRVAVPSHEHAPTLIAANGELVGA